MFGERVPLSGSSRNIDHLGSLGLGRVMSGIRILIARGCPPSFGGGPFGTATCCGSPVGLLLFGCIGVFAVTGNGLLERVSCGLFGCGSVSGCLSGVWNLSGLSSCQSSGIETPPKCGTFGCSFRSSSLCRGCMCRN